jgi:hypothetical protein
MTAFGGQTITLVSRAQTGVDDLGAAIITETQVDVKGCRHRPLTPEEAGSGGQARSEKTSEIGVGVSTTWWKSTIPVSQSNRDIVTSIQPQDAVYVDGQKFEVISGSHPFKDFVGRLYKVTVISEWQGSAI